MNTLLDLLENIRDCFGVYVCVHDVSGVTFAHAALHLPYGWKSHGCGYCEAAKRCIGVERCMLQKQLVMWRLKRNGAAPFFGICNMGVCEYILPVVQEGSLLAVVFASGVTREDADGSRGRLVRTLDAQAYVRRAEALAAYETFAASAAATRSVLRFLAELTKERILSAAFAYDGADANVDAYPVEAVSRRQSGTVRAVLDYIEGFPTGPVTLKDLSSVFFISEGHLCRIFKREMGVSIMAYLKQIRMRMAARLLQETDAPVSAIARQVGISDANYFCRTFKSATGFTPTDYRAAQAFGRTEGQSKHGD